ncbi:TetR/AcrR family transcriptional regulator [Microbacterium luticocti]|uniref:TetR/AcrR family transcriptional regulator n=1 Tax=Microbacterium luticocti TaxID=451764 RepID=UPI00040A774B|nr:TetR/AcrR family transcriptional regulator [Microbacterium luticocti]
MNPPSDHRSGPRRRGDALVAAILEAALAELAEVGYAQVTMDAVARRAGASKASLYRRWPSRAALVVDAVYRVAPDPEHPPDTGALRTDLLEMLRQAAAVLQGPAGEALRGIIAESRDDADRTREIRARSQGRNRRLVTELVRRAVDRGEVAASALAPARLDVPAALLRHHFLLGDQALDDALFVDLVDEVLLPLLRAPG